MLFLTDDYPETPGYAKAVHLFDDVTIRRLAKSLHGFASPEAEARFPLLIRRWAAYLIDFPDPFKSMRTARQLREELDNVAQICESAAAALSALSGDAMRRVAPELFGPQDDERGLFGFFKGELKAMEHFPKLASELCAVAAAATRTKERAKVRRGKPVNFRLREAVFELGRIYQEATGCRPTIRYDAYGSFRYGPFREFATIAMKRLFPRYEDYDGILEFVCAKFREKPNN